MASCWFHPEEEKTVGALLDYFKSHRGSTVTITFKGGEAYKCRFCASYDADNENELEDGIETVPVDYFAIALDPIEDISPGPHHDEPGTLIELSYRDFPKRIVAEDGDVIYGE